MTNIRAMLVAVLTALLLSACGGMGPVGDYLNSSNKQLASGIKSYEDGDYQVAAITIRRAQEAGLEDKRDQVIAYKYMAFIHCVSGREKQCREEFKNALEIDPTFELSSSEAGHPVWGPVFRSVRAKAVR